MLAGHANGGDGAQPLPEGQHGGDDGASVPPASDPMALMLALQALPKVSSQHVNCCNTSLSVLATEPS